MGEDKKSALNSVALALKYSKISERIYSKISWDKTLNKCLHLLENEIKEIKKYQKEIGKFKTSFLFPPILGYYDDNNAYL